MTASIEQAIRMRLMTPAERRQYDVEFSMSNLTKASLKDRSSIYSTMVQNGIWTRNQCRGFEGMEPLDGGDKLTAQTNLAPLDMLGKTANNGTPNQSTEPIKQ
jgi:phage portal protein BeeE